LVLSGPRLGNDGPDNMGTISDKVSAIDVSDVISFEQDPENHQYYRVFPAVRDDIVTVLNGTPQNQVPNRTIVSEGRWRIVPAGRAQRRTAAKPVKRRGG
jgi:esterase/lipase superfamily enzyme